LIESTFAEFEQMHPTSAYLQGFCYQIAQVYWSMRDWEKSKYWLKKVIEEAGPEESFYAATARARLGKLTY
jgi:hypothetical protein